MASKLLSCSTIMMFAHALIPASDPCPEGKRCAILLADDDPDIRTIVRSFLERDGLEVVEAADGHEALAWLERRPFDLLLVDLLMPGLDGFGVLHALRTNEGGQGEPQSTRLPVVVLSSMAQQTHRNRVMAMGAADFVVKPVDPEGLYLTVRKHLTRHPSKSLGN